MARGLTPENEAPEIEERVATWAREHPLTSPSFLRENPIPLWKQISQLSEGLSAVTSMEETLEDLTTRLNVYAVLLPKQARWQSELILGEYIEPQEMTQFLEDVDRVTVAIVKIAEFADTAVLDSMRRERVAILNSIDEQRVATLDVLSSQLAEVLRFIHAERLGMMAQMDSLTGAAVALATPRLEKVIDHIFWRTAQLFAGVVAACAVGGFVVFGVRRNRL